jgi:hypothetical protein
MPMCSHLLGRLPSDETPGVSPLGCALLAVRARLLVVLCRAHPTNFLTRYLPQSAYPTVRQASSLLSCVWVVYSACVAGMMYLLFLCQIPVLLNKPVTIPVLCLSLLPA